LLAVAVDKIRITPVGAGEVADRRRFDVWTLTDR